MTPELEELLLEARLEEQHLAPSPLDRERVRQRLRLTLGGGAALATTAVVSKAAAEGAALSVAAGAAEAGSVGGASFLSGVSGLKLAGWLLVGSALGLGGAWTSQGLLGVERPHAAQHATRSVSQKPQVALAGVAAPGARDATERADETEAAPGASVRPKAVAVLAASASGARGSLEGRSPRGSVNRVSATGNSVPAQRAEPPVHEAAPSHGILEELRRLKAAEAALGRGDLAEARRELADDSGALLAPERLGLSAITACRAGDKQRAELLHGQLLARFPTTPILPRVREAIAAGCGGPQQTSTDLPAREH